MEVTPFYLKYQTDLVILSSEVLALQHAATYIAYSGSSSETKRIATFFLSTRNNLDAFQKEKSMH